MIHGTAVCKLYLLTRPGYDDREIIKSSDNRLTNFTERSCIVRSQKRFNRYNGETDLSFISDLISGMSKDMLRRIAITIIFASPGIRASLMKLLMTSFLLGVGATLVLFWKAPWLVTWLPLR
jgi:hypothetical protein